jgi:hypothetical protein
MAIDVELKKKILSLVRENEEFRYALAGLLGLDTILFELKKLREDFLVFVKEQEKKWEEAFKRFEAIEKTLIEHTKILEEHTKILQEHSKRLEELSRAVAQIHVTLGRLGGRWGRNMEKMVLEIFKKVLEERGIELGKVERFEYVDWDGRFYKRGARIEIDVYVHDEKLYLIEVKSHADYDDVEYFHDVAQVVEKILNKKADKLILVATSIDENAFKRAGELGIDVIYGAIIPLD